MKLRSVLALVLLGITCPAWATDPLFPPLFTMMGPIPGSDNFMNIVMVGGSPVIKVQSADFSIEGAGYVGSVSAFHGSVANDNSRSFLNMTGALPTDSTADVYGINKSFTSAGSAAHQQFGEVLILGDGYTGTSETFGLYVQNKNASNTGDNIWGIYGQASNAAAAARVGKVNTGIRGLASNGAGGVAVGIHGSTFQPGTSIGVLGTGVGTTAIGGAFFLGAIPAPATLEALPAAGIIVDNLAVAAPVAIFRDNGTAVLTIADGGAVTSTQAITSSNAGSLGWSVVAGANAACTATCTNAAVMGFDTAAGTVPVGPADAAADICLCAGSN